MKLQIVEVVRGAIMVPLDTQGGFHSFTLTSRVMRYNLLPDAEGAWFMGGPASEFNRWLTYL